MNTKILIPEGVTEFTLREGQATKLQDPPAKSGFTIRGDIDAPQRFVEKKYEAYKDLWQFSHVIINQAAGAVTLIINEMTPSMKIEIAGQCTQDTLVAELGINSGKKYSAKDLAKTIRKFAPLFADRDECTALVNQYAAFTAAIKTKLEQKDNNYGSKRDLVETSLNTDVPTSFVLDCPIVTNGPQVKFTVNIFADVIDNEAVFTLDSVELHHAQILMLRELTAPAINFFSQFDGIPIIFQ